MLLCIWSIIGNRWHQNAVGAKKASQDFPVSDPVTDVQLPFWCLLSQLVNRHTATWNLFVLYNKETKNKTIYALICPQIDHRSEPIKMVRWFDRLCRVTLWTRDIPVYKIVNLKMQKILFIIKYICNIYKQWWHFSTTFVIYKHLTVFELRKACVYILLAGECFYTYISPCFILAVALLCSKAFIF